MHPMLASDVTGGVIIGVLLLLGGLATAVLALVALIPAWKGDKRLVRLMITPAVLIGTISSVCCVYAYFSRTSDHFSTGASEFFMDWVIVAGPPFATSLIALAFVSYRKRN